MVVREGAEEGALCAKGRENCQVATAPIMRLHNHTASEHFSTHHPLNLSLQSGYTLPEIVYRLGFVNMYVHVYGIITYILGYTYLHLSIISIRPSIFIFICIVI